MSDEIKGIKVEGQEIKVQFTAAKAVADENGNKIADTYAKDTKVAELGAAIKVDKTNIDELSKTCDSINSNVSSANSDISSLQRGSEATNKQVDNVKENTSELATEIGELTNLVNTLTAEVAGLKAKISEVTKNLGAFTTDEMLKAIVPAPVVGEYAMVVAPAKDAEGNFDATTYFGSLYIGNKTDNASEWHLNTESANGCVFENVSSDVKSYYIVDDATYQLLADLTIDDLVSHNHVTLLTIADSTAESKMYLYMCKEDGIWANTYQEQNITLAQTISSSNVIDEDNVTQSSLNNINASNASSMNNSLRKIEKAINNHADVIAELIQKVVYYDEIVSASAKGVDLYNLTANKVENHTALDEGTFPFVLG